MHYDKHDPKAYNNAMGRYKTGKQLDFIKRFLPRGKGRVLDVGGGNGRLAVPLADLGHHVMVLDESQEAITLLRDEGHPRIECVRSDVLSIAEKQPFDLALAVDSLKYMTHAPKTTIFARIGAVLAADGIFVLIEMNTGSWRYRVSQLLGRVCQYNIGTYREYLSTFKATGLEVMAAHGSHWMPFTFNSNSKFVSAFARIERLLLLDRWVRQSPWVMIAVRKGPKAPALIGNR